MIEGNFSPFSPSEDGAWITANVNGWENNDIGRYRIKYNIHKCGDATVIGQQMQDERGLMTIR